MIYIIACIFSIKIPMLHTYIKKIYFCNKKRLFLLWGHRTFLNIADHCLKNGDFNIVFVILGGVKVIILSNDNLIFANAVLWNINICEVYKQLTNNNSIVLAQCEFCSRFPGCMAPTEQTLRRLTTRLKEPRSCQI